MNCPKCGANTKVIDSREVENGTEIRRRRECEKCGHRFTTYERPQIAKFVVLKSDGEKEFYDREKLEKSILKAVNKTDVSVDDIENMLTELESEWVKNKKGVTSKRIGKDVLEKLKKLSEVAAIRYASVYYGFQSKEDFVSYLLKLYGITENIVSKISELFNLLPKLKDLLNKYIVWFVAKIKIQLYGVENKMFKQGDIIKLNFGYNIGSEVNKERYAIVISPNFISKFSNNLLVLPITSLKDGKKIKPDIHYVIKNKNINGLVLISNIRDVSKKRIIKKIGTLNPKDKKEIVSKLSSLFEK